MTYAVSTMTVAQDSSKRLNTELLPMLHPSVAPSLRERLAAAAARIPQLIANATRHPQEADTFQQHLTDAITETDTTVSALAECSYHAASSMNLALCEEFIDVYEEIGR